MYRQPNLQYVEGDRFTSGNEVRLLPFNSRTTQITVLSVFSIACRISRAYLPVDSSILEDKKSSRRVAVASPASSRSRFISCCSHPSQNVPHELAPLYERGPSEGRVRRPDIPLKSHSSSHCRKKKSMDLRRAKTRA